MKSDESPEILMSEPRRPVSMSVRHLMFLVLVAAFLLSIFAQSWKATLLFLVPLFVLAAVILAVTWLFRRREVHQRGLLAVLSIAAERGLPLSSGTTALAGLSSGGFRRKARILSDILDSGRPLPDALERLPGLLPQGAAALASLGWSEGALAAGLKEAQAAELTRRRFETDFVSKSLYLVCLLIGFQSVSFFMLYSILPNFEAILRDYGMEIPLATSLAVQAAQTLTYSGVAPVALLLELVFLGYLGLSSLGFLEGRLPGTNWLMRRRDAAAVLRGLAVTADAGRPITEGLRVLARYHAVGGIRRKLRRASEDAERGGAWTEALCRARLIDVNDVGLLNSAQRVGNVGWVLRTIAEGYERRLGYRLQLLVQLLTPIVILFAGVFVALTAVGYFLPLVTLIRKLGS